MEKEKSSQRKWKERILSLLKDNEIRKAIREIISETLSALDSPEAKAAQERNQQFMEENQTLRKEQDELKESNQQLQQALKTEQEKVQKLQHDYAAFDTMLEAYRKYNRLDEKRKIEYQQLIDLQSPLSFLLTGTSEENVKLIHDRIVMDWNKYDDSTLQILTETFDFLFQQCCVCHPDYARLEVQPGEPFENEVHMRTPDSPPVGTIEKVILKGYRNGNRLVKKSLVVVR